MNFQTSTTQPAQADVGDPSRPLSDWIIDLFNLDPDGGFARLLLSIVEPLFQIVVTIVLAWVVLRIIRAAGRRFINRAKANGPALEDDGTDVSRRAQRVEALGAVLSSLLGVLVWTGAFLTILGNTFGINLTPFLAGAGVVGIAIGFGAQDLVKDFVAGVFMLVEDQYGVGDVINVGEATGTVEKVTFRTTRIRDVNGTVWHFPNGEIRRVGNLSQEWSRALLDIVVGYRSDIDGATAVIRAVADEMAAEPDYKRLFLAVPEVWGVENIGVDGVSIRLVIKTLPGEQWAIGRELRRRIKIAFDREGIDAFSHRTVWLRSDGTPSDLPEVELPEADL